MTPTEQLRHKILSAPDHALVNISWTDDRGYNSGGDSMFTAKELKDALNEVMRSYIKDERVRDEK